MGYVGTVIYYLKLASTIDNLLNQLTAAILFVGIHSRWYEKVGG